MNAIELISLDLDGTLLESDLTILKAVSDALRAAADKGITVTLATGRAFPSAKKYADMLGINAPLICYNGAVIKTALGDTLSEKYLSSADTEKIIRIGEEHNWYLQLYNADEIVVSRISDHTLADPDYQNMPCRETGLLSDAALLPSPKIMTRCHPSETAERIRILKESFGDHLYIAGSTPHVVEIMSPSVSKAHALNDLCAYLNKDIGRTLACGDGDNDYEILVSAGIGCAMANATDKTKSGADYICKNRNGMGVLEALEKYIG